MNGVRDQVQEERSLLQSHYIALADQDVVRIAQAGDEQASEYLLYKYRSLVRTKIRSYL